MNLPRGGIWVRSTALLDMARHAEVAVNTYLLKDKGSHPLRKVQFFFNIVQKAFEPPPPLFV